MELFVNHRVFFVVMVCFLLCLSGCSSRVVRPVLSIVSNEPFIDYQAELVFSPDTAINVTVRLPPTASNCDSFCFPVQIPGAYEIRKYGKYISQFSVKCVDGQTMPYDKVDSSLYKIKISKPVGTITYTVQQTSKYKQDTIPPYTGIRIKSDYCMINPYAAFGFIPKYKDMPVRIRLILPKRWLVGTALPIDSSGYLYANSYYEMQDNPIIAGKLNHYGFANNTKNFFVYSYSDDPQLSALNLKPLIKKAVKDADNFLMGSIPSNYCFLFSFLDDSPSAGGAHEHANSSLYGFPTSNFAETKVSLEWIIRHELFHTLIPLSLKGDEIDAIDFKNSFPVSHLWFYEGLAQWAAYKMLVVSGSISRESYLRILRSFYLFSDTKDDSLDFLSLSRNMLKEKSSIADVYRRGLLFGNLLDMYIIYKTDGKLTLRETLLKMREQYPSGKNFTSDSIFTIISKLTHPDVKTFLENTLVRNVPVNTSELFRHFGISYSAREKNPVVVSEIGVLLRLSTDNNRLIIGGPFREAKDFGYKTGDTLLTVDGKKILPDSFGVSVKHISIGKPGTKYTAEVCGSDGVKRTINGTTVPYFIRHNMETTVDGLRLRNIWFSR
jgi:predicted metalloprotease with PDZ domain